jgi:hypothetical protein
MGAIVRSIEISGRPEDVFAYVTDLSHFPEWQGGVESRTLRSRFAPALGMTSQGLTDRFEIPRSTRP